MEEASQRLGEERKLIFENYCNGVDIEQMKAPFQRSAEEIERDILFVAAKIREYRFRRCTDGSEHASPPIACDNLFDIRSNRLELLGTLMRLGPKYLSSALILPSVKIQKLDHPGMVQEMNQRMRTA